MASWTRQSAIHGTQHATRATTALSTQRPHARSLVAFLKYHYDTIYQSTTMKLILALIATNLATIPTAANVSGTALHTSAIVKNVTIGHEEPTRAALSAVRRPLSVR